MAASQSADGSEMPGHATLLVVPRCPDDSSGTGQRSLMLLDGAARLGPVHVVALDGLTQSAPPPGAASYTALRSTRVVPKSRLGRRLVGPLRILVPGFAYRPDSALKAALLNKVAQTGARAVVFRYAETFCAAGLSTSDREDLVLAVDVDDRDDQKYLARLQASFPGSGPIAVLARNRVAAVARVLRRRLAQASLVWFVAAEDVWPGLARSLVLPNVPHGGLDARADVPPAASRDLLFVGIARHRPNAEGLRWFIQSVWPLVRADKGDVRLRVVGRGNWLETLGPLARVDGVDVIGAVEDLAGEYARARICISPVREGGGSKIKVVEAALYGRPIVASVHSLRGFDAELEDLALSSEEAAGFAQACLQLIESDSEANRRGAALSAWQKAHFSREATVAAVERALREEILRIDDRREPVKMRVGQ